MESPCACVDDYLHAAIFVSFLCTLGPLSRALVAYPLEMGWMLLHDVGGVNCTELLNIKTQVTSIWAKGCMSYYCACIICDASMVV